MDRSLTFSTSGELNSHSARCSATAPHRYQRVHSHDVIMAMQAADIRSDNGGIVGACVINGNLVSKGRAKARGTPIRYPPLR